MISTGISRKELELLGSIVSNNEGESLSMLTMIAKRVFTSFDDRHAIALGYLIGYMNATEKVHSEYYNSLQLCQRQN